MATLTLTLPSGASQPTQTTVSLPSVTQISTSGPSSVTARTSEQIVSQANQSATSTTFLSDYKINSATPAPTNINELDTYTNVNTFLTNIITSRGASTEGTIDTTNTGNASILSYLTYLDTTYLPTLRFVRQSLQEAQTPDYSALQNQRAITEESKSRYDSIKTPERRVSYYESWFPLVRPISEPGLFGLFGAGLLLLFLAIGFFLRLGGVEFQLILPTFFADSVGEGGGYMRYVYIGLVLGIATGLLVYAYYEKGWFGGPKPKANAK